MDDNYWLMTYNQVDTLPILNVSRYILDNCSWIVVRPSGTEPKIKINYSVKDANYTFAEKKPNEACNMVKAILRLD